VGNISEDRKRNKIIMLKKIWNLIFPLNVLPFNIMESMLATTRKSIAEKKSYEEKLEKALGPDVYKYVLLINVSALDGYIAQARLQAQQSFNLSRFVAIIGFIILIFAIGLSTYLTIIGHLNFNAAYLAGIAGVLVEFVAGVFFLLYSKTLNQINLFHDKLVDMQKTALEYLAKDQIKDDNISNESSKNMHG